MSETRETPVDDDLHESKDENERHDPDEEDEADEEEDADEGDAPGSYVDSALHMALQRYGMALVMHETLNILLREVSMYARPYGEQLAQLNTATATIRSVIYDVNMRAAKDALMLAHLSTDPNLRRQVYTQIIEWYTRENSEIMHLLEFNGAPPNSYTTVARESFQEEILQSVRQALDVFDSEAPWRVRARVIYEVVNTEARVAGEFNSETHALDAARELNSQEA